ncbi:MAG: flippase-like domain-containing protein [Candidatus Omnitrophica bacterium]|nr:flippase-like domain-containing protein [Candidatus Omnitrophota bacterium]
MPIKTKKYIRFGFILIITIGILIYLFQKIPFANVLNLIKEANFKIILLTLGISFINNFLVSAHRWKAILKHLGCPISLKDLLLIKIGSNPIISILPLKTGEFFRPLYLKRLRGISYSKSAFSILSEYTLNILALTFPIFIGIIIYLSQNNIFNLNLSKTTGIMFLYLSFLPVKHSDYYALFKIHLKQLKGLFKNKIILLYTSLFVFGELLNVYLLSKALHSPLPLYAILIFIPIVILISGLPITILGLGTRETAILFFLSKFAPPQTLLSLGILYSFVEHLFPMIIGVSLSGLFLNRTFWGKPSCASS